MARGTVLVTGGTVRIGAAIAAELRSRGWRVLVSSHRADAGADIVADLSEPSGAVRLYAEALSKAPDLCAVVNNAALFRGDAAVLEAVNFTAPQKLIMLLAGREGVECSVVNVLDARLLDGSAAADASAYAGTKRRLLDYTRKAACLFADSLRVNAVAPGPVLAPEGCHEPAGEMLLGRRPSPADVAAAVAYLLEAAPVTGVVIPVDSGQHLLMA